MLMYFLIGAAYLAAAIAGILTLLIGLSLTQSQRRRIPILRRISAHKLSLTIVTVICIVLNQGLLAWKDTLTASQPIDFFTIRSGGVFPKASEERFLKELKNRAEQLAQEASDHFKAGTRELVAQRYEDAARSFRRSVSSIPTMSGHLNLGVSLLFLDDFKSAEDNFREGLVIAQSQSDALLSALFYGNLAFVASKNGRGDEAKKLVTEAVHLHRKLNQQKEEALGLMNLGVLYAGDNRFREAVYYYDLAISIYDKIDDPLSHGMTLMNKGFALMGLRRFQESETSLRSAFIKLNGKQGNEMLAGAYAIYGELLLIQKRPKEALSYFYGAFLLLNKPHQLKNRETALSAMADAYSEEGNKQEELRILNELYEKEKARGETREQAETLIRIASVQRSRGTSTLALATLKQARLLLLELGDKAVTRRRYVDQLLFWQYMENGMMGGIN